MSPAQDFRPPARFRVLRRVGAGGMGAVYEALDENTGSRVALKTLTAVAPGRVLAFKEEFRSLAGFSHPNVATLYELLSADDQWFISMEFIEGNQFLEYVCAPKPGEATTAVAGAWRTADEETLTLTMVDETVGTGAAGSMPGVGRSGFVASPLKLRETMLQLAEAVMALHSAGILHRDLKPSNVMITPEGHLFVLDFGLAERLNQAGESSLPAHVSGTVTYMAPEQAAGEALSTAADWYAMGVMLYEALCGQCPFEGPVQTILRNKQALDPPPLAADIVERDAELAALCMELLRRDPATRPHGAEVIARLGGAAVSVPSSAFSVTRRMTFVGRESHLAALHGAFGEAERGTKVALIVGKSGMGKSALVGHFLAGLENRSDVLVLAGRCYEKESVPFKAFDSIVDSLARYLTQRTTAEVNRVLPRGVSALSQVFPVLNQVGAIGAAPERNPVRDARELRQRAFGALRELLIRMGDLQRLVIHIDDVQWGDGDSAALLRNIVQQPDAPEMLLIATCREEYAEQGELLAALSSQPDCLRVPVGPLTAEEAQQLAAGLYGAEDERAERVARESGGSPYFLQELRESRDGGAGQSSLDSVLYGRVAELPTGARQVVEIAAVSGRPLSESDACTAAGLGGEDQRILAMLRSQRLIRGASGEIETYHDRVREAVVAHLDADRLKHHHFALATTLESSGGDAEAIAEHFAGADEFSRAEPHYVRAAERASGALAFDHAAWLLSRAVKLSPSTGERRHRLRVKLADALANAGRGVDAARYYSEAAKGASDIALAPAEVFELERKAAYWFATSGHANEGRKTLLKMLRRVGIHVPGPKLLGPALLWAELQLLVQGIRLRGQSRAGFPLKNLERLDVCWDALRGFTMTDPPAGICVLSLNLPLALRTGEPARAAQMLIFYCIGTAAIRGSIVQRRIPGMLGVCEDLVARTNSNYLRAFLSFGQGMVLFVQGRWAESRGRFQQAEQVFTQECTGVAWELASTGIFTLWNLFYSGRYRELRRRAAILGQEARERGNLYLATSLGTGPQCAGELMAGYPDAALAMLDQSLSQWTQHQYSLQFASGAFLRAAIHLYRGEGAKGLAFLNGEWAASRKHHYLRLSGVRQWLRYNRAQCALSIGEVRLAEKDAKVLEGDVVPFAQILARAIRAGCAALRGDRPVAVRLLGEAMREFEAADMPMMAAAARRRLGVLTGEAGLVEEAESTMRAEGVADPERLTQVFVNGF